MEAGTCVHGTGDCTPHCTHVLMFRHVGGADGGMSRNAGDELGDSWNEGNIYSISE